MSISSRGPGRRWRSVVAVCALLAAAVAAVSAYATVQPKYERQASLLLVPGKGTVPQEAANPYLFLGSVSLATDVVVRAVQSDPTVKSADNERPGTEVLVTRDLQSSGPIIVITATSRSDADAKAAVGEVIQVTATLITKLQVEQGVAEPNQILASTLSKDTASTIVQRPRYIAAALAGGAALAVIAAVGGLIEMRMRRRHPDGGNGAGVHDAVNGEMWAVVDPAHGAEIGDDTPGAAARHDVAVNAGLGGPSSQPEGDEAAIAESSRSGSAERG